MEDFDPRDVWYDRDDLRAAREAGAVFGMIGGFVLAAVMAVCVFYFGG